MSDTLPILIPSLPLRDVVVFPFMVIPLFIGRKTSILALEAAMRAEGDKRIFLVAQKNPDAEPSRRSDVYTVGTVATILQLLRLPDGAVKVLVEGTHRAETIKMVKQKKIWMADLKPIVEVVDLTKSDMVKHVTAVLSRFEELLKTSKKLPVELLTALSNIQDPSRLVDTIAAHLAVKIAVRQNILETISVRRRFELLTDVLDEELKSLVLEKRIHTRIRQQVEKTQRHYYLTEKMKAIQQELGEAEDSGPHDEHRQLLKKIEAARMSKEAKEKALSELSKLKMMPPLSAEATVSRNYIDWLVQIPWKKKSKVSTDLLAAEAILDRDHYGLVDVKQRVLEYLAVQQRVKKIKGPILCLVGPPGVGKTSLGQSIATATGRPFARISLGGVRDEAEIRGHRRTYVGALPGKIIQKLVKVGVSNPLFMLDEIDKMAMDSRGDPASALLEVLDPEQNNAFADHYIEVDVDLSDVMFIATANSMKIPHALLDRMEIIRLPGYTEEEKINIASRYLVRRQMEQNGLQARECNIPEALLLEMIRYYTREAGVRSLEREISKLCRKIVKDLVRKVDVPSLMLPESLEKYLGIKKYRYGIAEKQDRIGEVAGLAWTEVGGELLVIEAQIVPGKGKFQHTGSLGDVMQESILAAMTVVRSRAAALGLRDAYFQQHDFHIHFPEGATPKDGPSAGVGICTALVSAMTQVSVHAHVAMTGEITLRGDVLPIGGLKEKLLAALRGGITDVIIPQENQRELKEIPENVTGKLRIHPVKTIDEVLTLALTQTISPLPMALTKTDLVYIEKKVTRPIKMKKKIPKIPAVHIDESRRI